MFWFKYYIIECVCSVKLCLFSILYSLIFLMRFETPFEFYYTLHNKLQSILIKNKWNIFFNSLCSYRRHCYSVHCIFLLSLCQHDQLPCPVPSSVHFNSLYMEQQTLQRRQKLPSKHVKNAQNNCRSSSVWECGNSYFSNSFSYRKACQ